MAITIEGFTVVVQRSRIQHLLDAGTVTGTNATALNDEHFWKCSFMAEADARDFMRKLETLGLNVSQGPDSDAVLVDEFERNVEPFCEWIQMAAWEKAIIAWKEGTRPESVSAREGWDPKVGSGLTRQTMQSLEFLRLDGNLEVFLDKKTGKEVYMTRTSTSVDAMFITASRVILKQFVTAGQPAVTGNYAREVSEAVKMLEKVIAEAPNWWNAHWFYGKGQTALGNHEAAYQAFRRAYDIEKTVESIPRELGGVCLELGKFDEAVAVAEATLLLDSGNAELLGNLAVSYVLAGRNEHAEKAIDAALKLAPEDKINQTISRILAEIADGSRPQPKSLADMARPAKKKGWFRFPW